MSRPHCVHRSTRHHCASCNISFISLSFLSHLLHSPCSSSLFFLSPTATRFRDIRFPSRCLPPEYHIVLPHSRGWDLWSRCGIHFGSLRIPVALTRILCRYCVHSTLQWQTQHRRFHLRRTTNRRHRVGNPDFTDTSFAGSWNACAYGIGLQI